MGGGGWWWGGECNGIGILIATALLWKPAFMVTRVELLASARSNVANTADKTRMGDHDASLHRKPGKRYKYVFETE